MNAKWFVCWSSSQCAQRIETEQEMLQMNARAFAQNRPVDFIPLAAFGSPEEANEFCDKMRPAFEQRFDVRRAKKGLS